MSTEARPRRAAWHWALLYADRETYADGVLHFVRTALDSRRPVFVAVPAAHGELLRAGLDGAADRVRFADMTEVGRNPNRIVPAIQAFVDEHRHDPVSFVGEPIWPGRTPAEIAEATRHEALINAAFEGSRAQVLCPYDVAGLDPSVVADAYRTHPELVDSTGTRSVSSSYTEPRDVWADVRYLPPPPRYARELVVGAGELRMLRQAVGGVAAAAGLSEARTQDLLLAVTELATNSIRYGGAHPTVSVWADADQLFCDVRDDGVVTDLLAGRRMPPSDAPGGRGLWLVNQLCDLVQLHSSADGTQVRITLAASG